MAKVYAIDGVVPVVDPGAFVHPAAILIGDVIIGSGVYVGPGASLRGDFGRIVIEAGANVQDNCIMHSFPDLETRIEENGHIGHGAILHGCTVGRNAMVGMNAVVMDGVVLGESSIVAAMAFVKSGIEIPPRSLVAGIPGKVIRAVTEEELAWKTKGTREYHELVRRCRESLVEAEPLAAPEPDRPRVRAGDIQPRYMMRKSQNGG